MGLWGSSTLLPVSVCKASAQLGMITPRAVAVPQQPVPELFGSELSRAHFHTPKGLRGGQANVSLWGCAYVHVCIHWGRGVVFVCCSCHADVREIRGGSSGPGQGLPAHGPAASSAGRSRGVPACPQPQVPSTSTHLPYRSRYLGTPGGCTVA